VSTPRRRGYLRIQPNRKLAERQPSGVHAAREPRGSGTCQPLLWVLWASSAKAELALAAAPIGVQPPVPSLRCPPPPRSPVSAGPPAWPAPRPSSSGRTGWNPWPGAGARQRIDDEQWELNLPPHGLGSFTLSCPCREAESRPPPRCIMSCRFSLDDQAVRSFIGRQPEARPSFGVRSGKAFCDRAPARVRHGGKSDVTELPVRRSLCDS